MLYCNTPSIKLTSLSRLCKKTVEAATKPESPKASRIFINPNTRGKEASLSTVMSHDDYRNTLEKQRRSLAAAEKDIARLKQENENLTQRLGIVTHHKSVFPPGSFHDHFFDVAPDLRPFDREAKMAEILKRPTRKDTWGSNLSNVRPERGMYLHREVNQDIDINCQQDESCYTVDDIENDNEDSSEFEASTFSKREVLRPSQLQWAKITGVPANPIPVLASDKTLAYREGTRVIYRILRFRPLLNSCLFCLGLQGPSTSCQSDSQGRTRCGGAVEVMHRNQASLNGLNIVGLLGI